jgi:hypothetical protein
MKRVLDATAPLAIPLSQDEKTNLRLAALLHDIGHYPYSHVMESIGNVTLTEELINPDTRKAPGTTQASYPDHEQVGRLIVTRQPDLVGVLGSQERGAAIADLFTRAKAADRQHSKLIHSSLDMDRLDYLLRDSHAAGVPYGSIDVNYILNNVHASKGGLIGVSKKALPAAEQFLMARHFMHRAVYYHKTTVAIEEACRQLLRRLRDRDDKRYDVPRDGNEVAELVTSDRLAGFTDAFVDSVVRQAVDDADDLVRILAGAMHRRHPPRMIREVSALVGRGENSAELTAFRMNCQHRLGDLATRKGLSPGQFLFWKPKPLKFEERGQTLTADEARDGLLGEEEEEAIKVFLAPGEEPRSIMDVPYSVMRLCAGQLFQFARLYFVPADETQRGTLVDEIRTATATWDQA